MKPLPKQPAAREKEKVRRAAVRARKAERRQRRREKRAARAAPRKALKQWSQIVLAAGKCAVCGIPSHPKMKNGEPVKNKRGKPIWVYLNAHHLLPRERYPELRTEIMNGICLCPIHHKHGKYSFHRNPIWAVIWLRKNRREQYDWCKQNMGQENVCQDASANPSNVQPRP